MILTTPAGLLAHLIVDHDLDKATLVTLDVDDLNSLRHVHVDFHDSQSPLPHGHGKPTAPSGDADQAASPEHGPTTTTPDSLTSSREAIASAQASHFWQLADMFASEYADLQTRQTGLTPVRLDVTVTVDGEVWVQRFWTADGAEYGMHDTVDGITIGDVNEFDCPAAHEFSDYAPEDDFLLDVPGADISRVDQVNPPPRPGTTPAWTLADDVTVIATITPQAWIDDNAVDIDPPGETVWNATAYATDHAAAYVAWLLGQPKHLERAIANGDAHLDLHDRFATDPAAPAWVADQQGPFSIYLTFHRPEPTATTTFRYEASDVDTAEEFIGGAASTGMIAPRNGQPADIGHKAGSVTVDSAKATAFARWADRFAADLTDSRHTLSVWEDTEEFDIESAIVTDEPYQWAATDRHGRAVAVFAHHDQAALFCDSFDGLAFTLVPIGDARLTLPFAAEVIIDEGETGQGFRVAELLTVAYAEEWISFDKWLSSWALVRARDIDPLPIDASHPDVDAVEQALTVGWTVPGRPAISDEAARMLDTLSAEQSPVSWMVSGADARRYLTQSTPTTDHQRKIVKEHVKAYTGCTATVAGTVAATFDFSRFIGDYATYELETVCRHAVLGIATPTSVAYMIEARLFDTGHRAAGTCDVADATTLYVGPDHLRLVWTVGGDVRQVTGEHRGRLDVTIPIANPLRAAKALIRLLD